MHLNSIGYSHTNSYILTKFDNVCKHFAQVNVGTKLDFISPGDLWLYISSHTWNFLSFFFFFQITCYHHPMFA